MITEGIRVKMQEARDETKERPDSGKVVWTGTSTHWLTQSLTINQSSPYPHVCPFKNIPRL